MYCILLILIFKLYLIDKNYFNSLVLVHNNTASLYFFLSHSIIRQVHIWSFANIIGHFSTSWTIWGIIHICRTNGAGQVLCQIWILWGFERARNLVHVFAKSLEVGSETILFCKGQFFSTAPHFSANPPCWQKLRQRASFSHDVTSANTALYRNRAEGEFHNNRQNKVKWGLRWKPP